MVSAARLHTGFSRADCTARGPYRAACWQRRAEGRWDAGRDGAGAIARRRLSLMRWSPSFMPRYSDALESRLTPRSLLLASLLCLPA